MTTSVVQPWFEARDVGDGVVQLWEPAVEAFLRCNVWLVHGRDRHLLVDTGLGVGSLREAIAGYLDRPVAAVATHTHYDHVGCMHEFEDRRVHPAEAEHLASPPPGHAKLHMSQFPDRLRNWMADVGYAPDDGELLTGHPTEDFDPATFATVPAQPTELLDEGDVVDLGDRAFQVVHLPGHTPGSIGLWEQATGILFTGDAVYDGPLLDIAPNSDIPTYIETMRRLRTIPVSVMHGGHGPSGGRDRFVELIDEYLRAKEGGT